MRQKLRLLGIGFWSLLSIDIVVGAIDWFARWDWLKSFMQEHPLFAEFVRTPFVYALLLTLGFLFLQAERKLKQPRLVGRYTNSRMVPDGKSATMKNLFDTESKAPGWDEARFDWDWFLEIQATNDSDTPATIDELRVRVYVREKPWKKRQFLETELIEDLDKFDMDMALNGAGHPHGKKYVGEHYQEVPSFMKRISNIPLEREIGHKGWIHLKVKKANQREIGSEKLSIDIDLIDAMQREHPVPFKGKSDKNWDNDFFIGRKVHN